MSAVVAYPSSQGCAGSILQSIVYLKFDKPLHQQRIKGKSLRGAIGRLYSEYQLLHQHKEDGRVDYCYPLVQYKMYGKKGYIVGLCDGAKLVTTLDIVAETLNLEGMNYRIMSKEVNIQQVSYKITTEIIPYSFLTPWLALNEENYEKYGTLSTVEQKNLLRRILIGNILSMSKGLGYVVTEEIKVSQLDVYPVKTPVRLKGVGMTGFKGSFSVNFDLPDYLGLGKSVSRGFGTIKRV